MENSLGPKKKRGKLEQIQRNALFTRIPQQPTIEAKRALVLESNPHHYAFGEIRRAWKPWLTYEENMAEEYLI